MVVDFFAIIEEDPQLLLADVWGTILEQRDAFEKVQKQCLDGLAVVKWPTGVSRLDRMACPICSSSLLGQHDPANTDHKQVIGRCFQCGEEIDFENFMELIVAASFEIDSYMMAKDGLNSPIANCPECGASAYVEDGVVSICFVCGKSVAGECARCGTRIDVNEYNYDHPEFCSYCAHMYDKVMRE